MIPRSKALYFIIGFCLYFAESTDDNKCPTSGGDRATSAIPRQCTSLIMPHTLTYNTTWSDGTLSLINSNITGVLVAGQLTSSENGTVIGGKFVNASLTAVYTYANISLDCVNNNGISGVSGTFTLNIVKDLGVFTCPGTTAITFNPPITNTLQTVNVTSETNYSPCFPIGVITC